MKKMKAFIIKAASFLTAAGILCGCAANDGILILEDETAGAPSTQIDLTFFGFKYEALNVIAIEEALRGFMDENAGISIAYDGIKSPGYFEVLNKRISTGNGNDIFMLDHERVLELGNQGKLADLSDLSTLDHFSDLAKSQMSSNGAITYLPTSISAFGLYCNLDLLKEHGQNIPENLAELEAVCDYFVSSGITPIVANNDISLKTVIIGKSMLPFYQTNAAAGILEAFNSKEADLAEALYPGFQLAEKMLDQGWIDREEALNTAKTKDDLVLFASGDRPFMLTGAWAVPRLRELQPSFKFEVRPYPIMEDGSVLVINVDTRVSVNAESPHINEAKRFVEYLTQSDVLWNFVESQSSFSPLKENRLASEEAIQSIGPYLTNGRSVIGADDNLDMPIWDMSRQCVVGMMRGDDADEAVSRMEQLMNEWADRKQGNVNHE